jgi:hypothetical protein
LDFLGFSRPNRDLSKGYTRFSAEFFPRAFVAAKAPLKRRPHDSAGGRAGLFMGKLNLISDFLQEIAARALRTACI